LVFGTPWCLGQSSAHDDASPGSLLTGLAGELACKGEGLGASEQSQVIHNP